jgi:hypothetical protein
LYIAYTGLSFPGEFLMKKIIKIACAVAISIVLLSCGLFGDEMPVMDSRVVSYQMIRYKDEHQEYFKDRFLIDKNILESWFPHIFNSEQTESKCNYFAMIFSSPSSTLIEYWVLSPAMVLYKIKLGSTKGCSFNEEIAYHAMLVCDDTEEGDLKDKINLNSIRSYTDEDWDCKKERKNVFF